MSRMKCTWRLARNQRPRLSWVLCCSASELISEVLARTLIERNPLPRGGFLFAIFPDPEPCVRDFTTRCDCRISSWNLIHMWHAPTWCVTWLIHKWRDSFVCAMTKSRLSWVMCCSASELVSKVRCSVLQCQDSRESCVELLWGGYDY